MQVLQAMLEQIAKNVGDSLPRLFGCLILLVAAWIVANILKSVARRAVIAAKLDQRFSQPGDAPLSQTIADIVYGLVWLIFLPGILGQLGLEGMLEPVQALVNKLLSFLPNILAAGIILIVGRLVARIIRQLATNLLAAIGVDRLSARIGIANLLGTQKLSGLIGLILYVLIFLPVLISALEALGLETLTRPASAMLNQILAALPNIFAATITLIIAILIGNAVSGLMTNLLADLGFNRLPARLGLQMAAEGSRSPAAMVGTFISFAIVYLAAIEAARMLGFTQLVELAAQFIVFASQIITGLIILAFGLWLANLANAGIKSSGLRQADVLSGIARIAIMVFAGAMALRQMGMASEIVNLAFGLFLGAIAVAAALAFGLGGRNFASHILEDWEKAIKSEE